MQALFRFLSLWPLWLLHAVGALLGWMAYALSGSYRRELNANVRQAALPRSVARGAVVAAGQMLCELPRLWFGAPVRLQWTHTELIDQALMDGRGVLFLTPHLGCFEATALGYAQRFGMRKPMTVLYRPARKAWLRALVDRSRQRPGLETVPTTLAGVKQLMRALKSGGVVGLLPDQVPPQGQGVWSPFFGRSAYTMTLAARLAQQTGALVLLGWGERLTWGRGYALHAVAMQDVLSPQMDVATAQINRAMEQLILQAPQQYLWGYARYKHPKATV